MIYHFVIKELILCLVSMSFTSLAAFHLDLLNSIFPAIKILRGVHGKCVLLFASEATSQVLYLLKVVEVFEDPRKRERAIGEVFREVWSAPKAVPCVPGKFCGTTLTLFLRRQRQRRTSLKPFLKLLLNIT